MIVACIAVELDGDGYTLDIDTVLLARTEGVDDAFVGLLRNFYFDQYRFFDGMRGGTDRLPPGVYVNNTGQVSLNETRQPLYPVTFRRQSYAAVSTLRVPGDGRPLSLLVRAHHDPAMPDQLFAYSAGVGGDFFAVELVDGGLLRVSADDGGGPVTTVVSDAGSLTDDRWHAVDVVASQQMPARSRPIRAADTSAPLAVVVDGKYRNELALVGGRNTLDLVGGLYVGGVPVSVYRRLPPEVRSRRGFSGCLATFVLNGRLYNILSDATFVSDSVTPDCTGI